MARIGVWGIKVPTRFSLVYAGRKSFLKVKGDIDIYIGYKNTHKSSELVLNILCVLILIIVFILNPRGSWVF